MQTVFGINNVALIDGEPKLLNLKSILSVFLIIEKKLYPEEHFLI